jgi:two-component system chemotaxis response regulator CheY
MVMTEKDPASRSIDPAKDCIVVAEDSPPNRNILIHLLRKLDFEVIEGEDGQAALDAMEAHSDANIVAVLSDIMMPNLNGIEFLKRIREHRKFKDIPFVLITAVADKDYIIEAKNHAVNGYILKPVTFDRVSGKLKELFPQRKFPTLKSS